jgi:hypothetical protein
VPGSTRLTSTDGRPLPNFHGFRHGFASAWIASGGDLVELSAHLGHRDPAITASTYSHEFKKAARSEARRARIDGMFGDALAVEPAVVDGGHTAVSELRPAPMHSDGL